VIVGKLLELSTRTTPEAITLELNHDFDHVGVQASIYDGRAFPVTDCYEMDIYRIGRNAVSWPVGQVLTLPLAYDEVLSPGVYTQNLHIRLNGAFYDVTGEERFAHFFEVIAGGLRPITSTEYTDRTTTTRRGPNGELEVVGSIAVSGAEQPRDPCVEPGPYSDEISVEEATSTVDFDSWVNVSTIQPLRWSAAFVVDGFGMPATLRYHARSTSGARLRLQIPLPEAVSPMDLEVMLRGQARLTLDEARPPNGGRPTSWYATDGRVLVRSENSEQLRIEFSEVVFDKERMITEPQVTRGVMSGSIVGAWIRE
jgi:hypothetical protein